MVSSGHTRSLAESPNTPDEQNLPVLLQIVFSKPTNETFLLLPSQQSSCSSAVCPPTPPLRKSTSGLASGAGWELYMEHLHSTRLSGPEVVWLAPRARRNLVCQLPEFHGRLSSLSCCRSSVWTSSRTLSGSSCCSLLRSHHVTVTVICESSQEQRRLRGLQGGHMTHGIPSGPFRGIRGVLMCAVLGETSSGQMYCSPRKKTCFFMS